MNRSVKKADKNLWVERVTGFQAHTGSMGTPDPDYTLVLA
jgi:hypothetical protein